VNNSGGVWSFFFIGGVKKRLGGKRLGSDTGGGEFCGEKIYSREYPGLEEGQDDQGFTIFFQKRWQGVKVG